MAIAKEPILISSRLVIRKLKEKNLIPHWIDENGPLPPDPDRRLIFVHIQSPHEVFSKVRSFKKYYMERFMNYSEMAEAVREGAHARRSVWKAPEKLWSDGKILIHNTPYFGEPFNQGIQGYAYVCEQVDVVATDWELVSA